MNTGNNRRFTRIEGHWNQISFTGIYDQDELCFFGFGPAAGLYADTHWKDAPLILTQQPLPTTTEKIKIKTSGTQFQKAVWHALQHIPKGVTISYKQLALSLGIPRAVRAVANAVGKNPVSFFIPCHRVIKSDGSLCGFRWGIEVKKILLNHEKGKLLC